MVLILFVYQNLVKRKSKLCKMMKSCELRPDNNVKTWVKPMLSGYTESNKLVNFKGPEYLRGLIVPVKIIEDHAFSMIGELVEDPILSLTKALASSLKQEPVIAEFLATSAALEQDPSILALRQEIKEAERQAVSLSKVHPEEYLPAKKKYDDLMKRYHDQP